jgi:hypothetical protein
LKQSISTSLEVKIAYIENMGYDGANVRDVIRKYPSILAMSETGVQKRLKRSIAYTSTMIPLTDALDKSAKIRRSNKAVWLMSISDNASAIDLVFNDVTAAALHADTSVSNMYKVLRLGKNIRGRQYIYESVAVRGVDIMEVQPVNATVPINLERLSSEIQVTLDEKHCTSQLCIHTAGRAFPPEDSVRGRKRSGGMALQVRKWTSKQWGSTCSNLWKGQRVRLLSDGSTLIIGYPFTRPSRRRCSLYACREALRVAKEWLLHEDSPNKIITIACDSNYALKLLQNVTRLCEAGSAKSVDDFQFDGPIRLHEANPDILYSIARLCYLLLEQSTSNDDGRANLSITFIATDVSDSARRLRDGAKLAATLMYDTVR